MNHEVRIIMKAATSNASRTTAFDFFRLKELASGTLCPNLLNDEEASCLLANGFLVRDAEGWHPTEKLFWQTGVKQLPTTK